ncbi:NADPH-dependent FMN reductase [Cupriavidus sp. 2SB]|uniref:NADPH-dependent FMN reductase n=1 Tax=unclassified Cupriavidus TaxID=2640874 RepID=UPI0010F6ED79|nr:NADPH-dependent FMN reductase [Cupriavidus sp. 2SB]
MAERLQVKLLVGSLRESSINRRLATALMNLLAPDMDCAIVEIGALPHYNEDDESRADPDVLTFRSACSAADAFIFVTPEYNRSIPGVLKNAIDYGSRPKDNSVWKGLPCAVIGASPGVLGTCMAQQHLRNILAALDMAVMAHQEAYIHARPGLLRDDGLVTDEAVAQFLARWCSSFRDWTHLIGRNRSP